MSRRWRYLFSHLHRATLHRGRSCRLNWLRHHLFNHFLRAALARGRNNHLLRLASRRRLRCDAGSLSNLAEPPSLWLRWLPERKAKSEILQGVLQKQNGKRKRRVKGLLSSNHPHPLLRPGRLGVACSDPLLRRPCLTRSTPRCRGAPIVDGLGAGLAASLPAAACLLLLLDAAGAGNVEGVLLLAGGEHLEVDLDRSAP